MPISIRLDQDTAAQLERAARELKVSKSDLVKNALKSYLTGRFAPTPYELAEDLIAQLPPPKGKRTDRARRAKQLFREMVRAKHSR